MQKIGSALSLFHNESLLSKVYRRDARTHSHNSKKWLSKDCRATVAVSCCFALSPDNYNGSMFCKQVRKALAQVVTAMAHNGYLDLEGGDQLVEFIMRQCSLSDTEVCFSLVCGIIECTNK